MPDGWRLKPPFPTASKNSEPESIQVFFTNKFIQNQEAIAQLDPRYKAPTDDHGIPSNISLAALSNLATLDKDVKGGDPNTISELDLNILKTQKKQASQPFFKGVSSMNMPVGSSFITDPYQMPLQLNNDRLNTEYILPAPFVIDGSPVYRRLFQTIQP